MLTNTKDVIDKYVDGLVYEVKRELQNYEILTPCFIAEVIEQITVEAMKHECAFGNKFFLNYVMENPLLQNWYETNESRYSEFFTPITNESKLYLLNPNKYSYIWGNLTLQIVGVIYGNIREELFVD
jgi:hypothetical protein